MEMQELWTCISARIENEYKYFIFPVKEIDLSYFMDM